MRQTRAARFYRDAVGDDEAGIKTHAKLADEVGVFFLLAFELGHKFARAALGDGAQVRHRFFGAHADAVVADRQPFVFHIKKNMHFKIGGIFVQRTVVQGFKTQLVAGV